jgi:hypothetical protein
VEFKTSGNNAEVGFPSSSSGGSHEGRRKYLSWRRAG